MSERILVVDDEAVLRRNIVRLFESEGHSAEGVGSAEEALVKLAEEDRAVVITDLRMPGMSGIALLEEVVARHPDTLVIVITAHASLQTAIEALRLGAQDYLLKPLSLDELARKVARLLSHRELEQRVRRLRQELHRAYDPEHMVATSPAMAPVLSLVGKAAASRSTVLIEGESGTGKELIARALHEQSPWAERDFIPVNLAAQPAELVDAALFGHERGAFTGATRAREGVFRAAHGGTVFLDEVGELPAAVQVKLLRVLENHEVLPLGSDRAVPVDFRLVCASNRPLQALVEAGSFRQDLFFRLDVLRVVLPPLRERPEDIAPLAWHFLARHAATLGRPAPSLGSDALRLLQAWPWPGNVRELSNLLERAVLLCEGDHIQADLLPADLHRSPGAGGNELKAALAAFERQHIARVLAACKGDKVRAAEALGIHLATLYRRLERGEE